MIEIPGGERRVDGEHDGIRVVGVLAHAEVLGLGHRRSGENRYREKKR